MSKISKEKIGKMILKTIGLKNALKLYYRIKTGRKLNLKNPTRYSEKIQLRKYLHHSNELYILCADKYKVREYIKEKIGEEYLVPMYFAKEQITVEDLEKLPNAFVLKTNNATKTNIIVRNKQEENLEEIVRKMNEYTKLKFGYRTFELFYNKIKPMIIAEKYIGSSDGLVPNDFKFFCFKNNGSNPKIIIQVDYGRFSDSHVRHFYNEDWKEIPMTNRKNSPIDHIVEKPQNYEKMLEIVKILGNDFDFVRVDLYEVEGKIYFGELTFTDGSGYNPIKPDEYDKIFGSYWHFEQ